MEKLSIYGEIEDIRMDQANGFCVFVKFCYRDDAINAFLVNLTIYSCLFFNKAFSGIESSEAIPTNSVAIELVLQ